MSLIDPGVLSARPDQARSTFFNLYCPKRRGAKMFRRLSNESVWIVEASSKSGA